MVCHKCTINKNHGDTHDKEQNHKEDEEGISKSRRPQNNDEHMAHRMKDSTTA